MKLNLNQTFGFMEVYDELQNNSLPITLAYKLSKIHSLLQHEAEFYKEQLNNIINTYAQFDEHGNIIRDKDMIKIQPDSIEICKRKLEELDNLTVSVDDKYLFNLSELEDIHLSPNLTSKLSPFINE